MSDAIDLLSGPCSTQILVPMPPALKTAAERAAAAKGIKTTVLVRLAIAREIKPADRPPGFAALSGALVQHYQELIDDPETSEPKRARYRRLLHRLDPTDPRGLGAREFSS